MNLNQIALPIKMPRPKPHLDLEDCQIAFDLAILATEDGKPFLLKEKGGNC